MECSEEQQANVANACLHLRVLEPLSRTNYSANHKTNIDTYNEVASVNSTCYVSVPQVCEAATEAEESDRMLLERSLQNRQWGDVSFVQPGELGVWFNASTSSSNPAR